MKNKYLILAPHTDDGEWGCGASIVKWLEQGHEVHYVAFSAAEESVPLGLAKDILRTEILQATKILGVNPNFLTVLNYEVRNFPRDRQALLEDLLDLRRKINPNVVLVPSTFDTHQDHEVINREAFRAFKKCTILGYELAWNTRKMEYDYFNGVCIEQLNLKISAIAAYKSQEFRVPNYSELIRSSAVLCGARVGLPLAEAFEVIRWVDV